MAPKKIAFNIADPKDAREFIRELCETELPGITCVETNRGRKIWFAHMSDADACLAARILYDLVDEASQGQVRH